MNEIASDPRNEVLADFAGTPNQYVNAIENAWDHSYGQMWVEEYLDNWLKPYWEVKLATGGWSLNEDVVAILKQSLFSYLFWESSHRGGLHVYHVSRGSWQSEFEQLGMP